MIPTIKDPGWRDMAMRILLGAVSAAFNMALLRLATNPPDWAVLAVGLLTMSIVLNGRGRG